MWKSYEKIHVGFSWWCRNLASHQFGPDLFLQHCLVDEVIVLYDNSPPRSSRGYELNMLRCKIYKFVHFGKLGSRSIFRFISTEIFRVFGAHVFVSFGIVCQHLYWPLYRRPTIAARVRKRFSFGRRCGQRNELASGGLRVVYEANVIEHEAQQLSNEGSALNCKKSLNS